MVQLSLNEILPVRIVSILQWIAAGAVIVGLLMLVFGIVLAVYLKKKEKKKE